MFGRPIRRLLAKSVLGQTQKRPGSSYSNFGHQKLSRPWFYHLREVSVVLAAGYFSYKYAFSDGVDVHRRFLYKLVGLREVVLDAKDEDENEVEDIADGFDDYERALSTKSRLSFRQRRIVSYENRLRNFSSYDKVFRYFATLRTRPDFHECPDLILMTRADFVRAITPDLVQPEGLELDRFRKYDPGKQNWRKIESDSQFPRPSVFDRFIDGGLLSYEDFVFLVTTLSIPIEQLRYVFRMIDADDNGRIEPHEYDQMRALILKNSAFANSSDHEKHFPNSQFARLYSHGSLKHVFFPRNQRFLLLDEFLSFFVRLHDELNWIEFMRYATKGPDNTYNEPSLTTFAFCRLLSTYIFRSDRRRKQMKEQARERLKSKEISDRISFADYKNFTRFLEKIPDAKRFFFLYARKQSGGAGTEHGLDKRLLKRLALDLAEVRLSDTIVDSLFAMFDVNGDGLLNEQEFFRELKRFTNRASGRRRNGESLGVVALLKALPKYLLRNVSVYDCDDDDDADGDD